MNIFEKLPKDIWFLIFNFSISRYELTENKIFKDLESLKLVNKKIRELILGYIKQPNSNFNYINFKADLMNNVLKCKSNSLNFLQKIDIRAINSGNSGLLLSAIEFEATTWISFYRKEFDLEKSLSNIMTKLALHIIKNNYCVDDIFNGLLNKIVGIMLISGFDVNFKDFNYKNSFLNIAVKANNLNLIKILVEQKADINCKNALSETPLFAASKNDNYNIVCFLLSNRADPGIKNSDGEFPVNVTNSDMIFNLIARNMFNKICV